MNEELKKIPSYEKDGFCPHMTGGRGQYGVKSISAAYQQGPDREAFYAFFSGDFAQKA